MKNRKVLNGSLQHIYKTTADGGVLFYHTIDHLVCFTIQSVMARRHNLPVLCACHMFTHTHELAAPVDPLHLVSYEHDVNLLHAREWNRESGRTGRLYRGPFGSAPKRSDKDKRSCVVYILNNPVEKRLCARAVEDRWNFLAYYEKEYPFSERPVLRYCRWALRNAMHEVSQECRAGRYLKYALLYRLFSQLNRTEQEQLTDYIIQRYFYFDREACYQLFGNGANMVAAADVSKGKEFDVGESFDPYSDVPYREMSQLAARHGLLGQGKPLLLLPEERREKLSRYLQMNTSASELQVARFLHAPSGLVGSRSRAGHTSHTGHVDCDQ